METLMMRGETRRLQHQYHPTLRGRRMTIRRRITLRMMMRRRLCLKDNFTTTTQATLTYYPQKSCNFVPGYMQFRKTNY
jgi:hypothetical protein